MRHAAAWQLARCALGQQKSVALITVAAVKGSAPREVGACLCVTEDQQAGTIGGGTLEFKAIESARELLRGEANWLHQQLGLGPALGQCCGGRVELLIERLDRSDLNWLNNCTTAPLNSQLVSHYSENFRSKTLRESSPARTNFGPCAQHQLQLTQMLHPGHFNVLLFGAGHVGQALVPLLSKLPCQLQWFDSREQVAASASTLHAPCEWLETPSIALADAPTASLVLVMTHSHALDFEITASALRNQHIAWVGMIGSEHKRKQFEHRLCRSATVTDTNRLACPIGQRHTDIRDPAELALLLATELLHARNHVQHAHLERNHA